MAQYISEFTQILLYRVPKAKKTKVCHDVNIILIFVNNCKLYKVYLNFQKPKFNMIQTLLSLS